MAVLRGLQVQAGLPPQFPGWTSGGNAVFKWDQGACISGDHSGAPAEQSGLKPLREPRPGRASVPPRGCDSAEPVLLLNQRAAGWQWRRCP